jgi:hypothetical protein
MKRYKIQHSGTQRKYTVIADSFQSACERLGIMPADAILLAPPTPVHAPNLVYSASGQVIGEVSGRVFRRRFKGSVHMLRKPPALAVEKHAYLQARAQFDALEWVDSESGRVYTCSAATFERYGFEIQRGEFPVQLALPLRYWAVHDPHAKQQQLALLESV